MLRRGSIELPVADRHRPEAALTCALITGPDRCRAVAWVECTRDHAQQHHAERRDVSSASRRVRPRPWRLARGRERVRGVDERAINRGLAPLQRRGRRVVGVTTNTRTGSSRSGATMSVGRRPLASRSRCARSSGRPISPQHSRGRRSSSRVRDRAAYGRRDALRVRDTAIDQLGPRSCHRVDGVGCVDRRACDVLTAHRRRRPVAPCRGPVWQCIYRVEHRCGCSTPAYAPAEGRGSRRRGAGGGDAATRAHCGWPEIGWPSHWSTARRPHLAGVIGKTRRQSGPGRIYLRSLDRCHQFVTWRPGYLYGLPDTKRRSSSPHRDALNWCWIGTGVRLTRIGAVHGQSRRQVSRRGMR